jgi:hypothetical protein
MQFSASRAGMITDKSRSGESLTEGNKANERERRPGEVGFALHGVKEGSGY